MNPVLELANVARKIAALGDQELAARVRAAASTARRRQAASTDIVLDSWSEFESWLLKNRSQGLEFVFEDQYGADSREVTLLRDLLEGYDLIERKTHDLYEMLQADTPAPEPEESEEDEEASVADDVEAVDASEEESLADVVEEATEPGAEAVEGEEAAAEGEATEEEVTSEEAAAEEEAPTEAEEAAEEALAPAKAEASVKPDVAKTSEAKTITRLTKLLRKAKVETVTVAFAGNNSYRIQFPDAASLDAASKFFAKTGMAAEVIDHPVKMFLTVTP